MRVLLIGPPGSGKGTQAARIQNALGIPHISSGDLLRDAAAKKTRLGNKAEQFMSQGLLVPDDLVIKLIMERIAQPDAREGFLLDGFPRTRPQAEALAEALRLSGYDINHVLKIQVPDEEIIVRISGRRIDPKTKTIYHVKFNPPPPEIASRVIQRTDDNEVTLKRRLRKYHDDTQPIIKFYDEKGLLTRISGTGSLDEVQERIFGTIGVSLNHKK